MATKQTFASRIKESNHKSLVILRCKLLIVGDACTGKSALTQVFTTGGAEFPKNYLMTIGADFTVKQVTIPDTNMVVEFYIYDCGGQSIFNQLDYSTKYYDNAAAMIVTFDIGNKDSFQSCPKWAKVVKNANGVTDGLFGVLVGCKSDVREDSGRAEVIQSDAIKMASELKLTYFEKSSARNNGVDEPFKHIANEYYKKYMSTTGKANDDDSRMM